MTAKPNTPRQLAVINKLEVGPVRIEPKRLVMPYKVFVDQKTDENALIYKYDEKVFNPDSQDDLNLAGMIGAQVALNYGMFCEKIVFTGMFDQQDRQFIKDMMENTSREIFVKKILEPNPFIIKDAIKLDGQKFSHYTNAEIKFISSGANRDLSWQLWQTHPTKHAILSSGGKDSLLSYGLLSEIGREIHPIFINESGRHWYTALNAYRYFKNHIVNTGKVWTNSDRMFNWMLRHFPFIRQDFASIRSDEYPIRLWTVAVFLFGALPLLKKREIGRLIIGDEYDTTVRRNYQGITHYDGLYDQSRYFDNALSRYFLSKGWSIAQFSLLRPLSELLILKILSKRYPELQKNQVSCHAASIIDDRVYPCGHCEKCRRIIGMLKALDSNIKACGYKDDQIEASMQSLVEKGIHQEAEGYQHLLYILNQKKIIQTTKKPKERPEIQKIRIDHQRSPIKGLPVDLRIPLLDIFQEYADGIAVKSGNTWKDIDGKHIPDLDESYPFETSEITPNVYQKKRVPKYIWGHMTWPEAEKYLEKVDIAILPVGAIEQHGPHLPLDTDSFDADYLARQVASACSEPRPLVLPLVPYGVSYHHEGFKGTVSINNDTLSRLVYEVGMSLAQNGIKKIIIINGHGGNGPSLNFAAQMINRDARIFVSVDSGETSDVDIYQLVDTPNDVHAGEFETSTTLAIRPDLVKMSLAKKSVPQFSSRYLNFTSKRGISWYAYTKKLSESGIMGDPTNASAEKGKRMWQIMIAHLVTFIEELKHLSLEEIHQRRY